MIKYNTWLKRPLSSLSIILGCFILSIFLLFSRDTNQKKSGEISIMIVQRHYGVNAREMERTVAIPLEDIISNIQEVESIVTISENSQVRCYIRIQHNMINNSAYDAVREAAQRVYESLPSSAQRPELSTSSEAGVPVWIAALWGSLSGDYIERTIKPVFEAIEGVSNVEVSGAGNKQILISPDPEKIAALGLSTFQIALILNKNDSIYSGGILRSNNIELPIIIDSRYEDLSALKNAFIPYDGGIVKLADIAEVYETEREGDIISRLNGQKTIVIVITASAGVNLGILSGEINRKLTDVSNESFEFKVLQDRGAEEANAFRLVLVAALFSSILVALSSFLLIRKKKGSFYPGLICAASIPVITIISAAFLSFVGFPIDRKLLAGLSIGIGAAADAVLLTADGFTKNKNVMFNVKSLNYIVIPLVSAAATTIAALFPLASFSKTESINVIVWALGTVTLFSMLISLIFLPPLLIWANNQIQFNYNKSMQIRYFSYLCGIFINKVQRKIFRLLMKLTYICCKKPFISIVFSVFITVAAIIALSITGTDISTSGSENSIYARIEFESGFVKEEIDNYLAIWALGFIENTGIEAVQTSARTGSGQILITFNQSKVNMVDVKHLLASSSIPGGFIYIPEPSKDDQIWEIKVYGDDDHVCRELAEKAATAVSILPQVREVVLNFKDGNPRLTLFPQRDRFAEADISFAFAADNFRRWIYGPVIYKRFDGRLNNRSSNHGEIDVRLGIYRMHDNESSNIDYYLKLPIPINNSFQAGTIRFDSLNIGYRDFEPSLIRREDRRRMASFSIKTSNIDPRKIRSQTMELLKKIDLPKGYVLEFDPEAIRHAEAISGMGFKILVSLFFCYMVISSANESLKFPFLVLSAVPPSLSAPILFLVLTGTVINASIACSLVAVCGITVNASIIIAAEFKRSVHVICDFIPVDNNNRMRYYYSVIRRCIPVLIATTGTTIIGAIPFLFLLENNNSILKDLSFVTIFGVSSSLICSLFLIPSIIIISKKNNKISIFKLISNF